VREAIDGYRAGIDGAAAGAPPGRVTSGSSPIVADVFRRSERDGASRRELADLASLEGGTRRLKRGAIDPDDPQTVYADLARAALEALPAAIERWRRSLLASPPPEHVTILDAVREFGSARAIAKRIAADPERFVEEQVEIGVAYAEQVIADHARFVRALHRRDGLRLGIPFDPADAPGPDVRAVLGIPPPLPPLPPAPSLP